LHGSILYYLIQRSIYENAHPDSKMVVKSRVGAFVDGVVSIAGADVGTFGISEAYPPAK
jgi:hypothetical protein